MGSRSPRKPANRFAADISAILSRVTIEADAMWGTITAAAVLISLFVRGSAASAQPRLQPGAALAVAVIDPPGEGD